jgi:hypothetical protein
MKRYSLDDLRKMSPSQRATLYQNARRLRAEGGQAVMDLIDQSGLPLSEGDLTSDDPAYIRMIEIISSSEGRKAALDAVALGLPALAGVDPLVSADLGDQYGPHNGGTIAAGYIVAGLMRQLGYSENGVGKCPDNCVAKTGMKWMPRGRSISRLA